MLDVLMDCERDRLMNIESRESEEDNDGLLEEEFGKHIKFNFPDEKNKLSHLGDPSKLLDMETILRRDRNKHVNINMDAFKPRPTASSTAPPVKTQVKVRSNSLTNSNFHKRLQP